MHSQASYLSRIFSDRSQQQRPNGGHLKTRYVTVYERGIHSDGTWKDVTLDILGHYCQVDKEILYRMAGANEPRNTLLLTPNARAAFIRYKWCLLSTEVSIVCVYFRQAHPHNTYTGPRLLQNSGVPIK